MNDYVRKLGKLLEKKDLDGIIKLAAENGIKTPKREAGEIAMYKMILARTDMSEDLKEEAKEWLLSRGYSLSIF